MNQPATPPDLAALAQQLEQIIKPGYSIARTKLAWYLRKHDSWVTRDGIARLGWRDVDSDWELGKLLSRLEKA